MEQPLGEGALLTVHARPLIKKNQPSSDWHPLETKAQVSP